MEVPEPDAAGDDAMDSFLEKFQSQPYHGGFHEDQWEEVGGLGPRTCVAASSRPPGLAGRGLPRPRPPPRVCPGIGVFYLGVLKTRTRGLGGRLRGQYL